MVRHSIVPSRLPALHQCSHCRYCGYSCPCSLCASCSNVSEATASWQNKQRQSLPVTLSSVPMRTFPSALSAAGRFWRDLANVREVLFRLPLMLLTHGRDEANTIVETGHRRQICSEERSCQPFFEDAFSAACPCDARDSDTPPTFRGTRSSRQHSSRT